MTPIARAPNATPRLRQNLALIYGLKGDDAAARALSRIDLSKAQADGNLNFFDLVRARTTGTAAAHKPQAANTAGTATKTASSRGNPAKAE